jgi:hypothetical protein
MKKKRWISGEKMSKCLTFDECGGRKNEEESGRGKCHSKPVMRRKDCKVQRMKTHHVTLTQIIETLFKIKTTDPLR